MTSNGPTDELEVLRAVKDALAPLGPEESERIYKRVVSEIYHLDSSTEPRPTTGREWQTTNITSRDRDMSFADRETLSPKDFLHEKQPQTDIERVACLAYYLSQYRDTPHFKTLDISKLNTEAAQLKFSNPAAAVANATSTGLLTPASKGKKQISAIGERFVDALPDHDAAKLLLRSSRSRRGRRASSVKRKARQTSK